MLMLITISGTPGAGKGTTAAALSTKLRIPYYSIGDIQRNLALSRGQTLEEFGRYQESHPKFDRQVDRWQGTMAKKLGRGIFEGRVSYHFIPKSIKIYLHCSLRTGAIRLRNDPTHKRRHEGDFSTLAKTIQTLRRRMISENRRYMEYYDLNIHDPNQYDLIIKTDQLTTAKIVKKIMDFFGGRQKSLRLAKRRKKGG